MGDALRLGFPTRSPSVFVFTYPLHVSAGKIPRRPIEYVLSSAPTGCSVAVYKFFKDMSVCAAKIKYFNHRFWLTLRSYY
jgi:hypothetical protein